MRVVAAFALAFAVACSGPAKKRKVSPPQGPAPVVEDTKPSRRVKERHTAHARHEHGHGHPHGGGGHHHHPHPHPHMDGEGHHHPY